MRKTISILIALTISLSIQAQMRQRKIKAKADYKHTATEFNFPLTIDQYHRTDIYAFDKQKQNVEGTYKTDDSKAAFVDSLMLGSAMGSAFKKNEWVMDNVDSLERASGFPGLYLEMHIASLKEFTEFERKHPDLSKTKRTEQYGFDKWKIDNPININLNERFYMIRFRE